MSGFIELTPKQPTETRSVVFDFISSLGVAETISTQSVTATVWSGVDASPASVVSGAATATGTQVTQKLAGGVSGVIYKLVCTITTSLGQTLTQTAYLPILTDSI